MTTSAPYRVLSHDHFLRVREGLAAAAAARRLEDVFHRKANDVPPEKAAPPAPRDLQVETPLTYHLTYAGEGRDSARVVTLQRVDPDPNGLKLWCWCHASGSIRQFRADRIREVFCVVTGEVFDDAVAYFTTHPMLTDPEDPEAYALAVCRPEVNILVAVGAADGHFDPDEQDRVLIHVYDRMPDLDLDEDRLRRRIAKLAPDCRAFDTALWRMSRFRHGDPAALLRSIRKLVDADGRLATEELAFVDEISGRLSGLLGKVESPISR